MAISLWELVAGAPTTPGSPSRNVRRRVAGRHPGL
jgi:hypothetical protein